MLQIDDKILSLDLFEKKFCCDVQKCKGACCIHGDSGAPLEPEEATYVEENIEVILPYVTENGVNAIKEQGTSMVDSDGDTVTPLINNSACAYINYDDEGIAYCGIEKAWNDGKVSLRKPVSCHLYPIRTKKYRDFEGMNYDKWDICKPALKKGEQLKLPIFKFAKEAIIRKYGEKFYSQLEVAEGEILKNK